MHGEESTLHLLQKARSQKQKAYAPYSHFQVGSALLCLSGEIYTGCNTETYTNENGLCAERNAIFKAITHGEAFADKNFIDKMGITCSAQDKTKIENISPCGPCRQVTKEFAQQETFFVADNDTATGYILKMNDILPFGFRLFDDEIKKPSAKPDFKSLMEDIKNTDDLNIIFKALESLSQNSYVPAGFHSESCVVVSSSGNLYAGVRIVNSCTNLTVSAFKVAANQFAAEEKSSSPASCLEKIYLFESGSPRTGGNIHDFLPADLLNEFGAKEIAVHLKANGNLSEFTIN